MATEPVILTPSRFLDLKAAFEGRYRLRAQACFLAPAHCPDLLADSFVACWDPCTEHALRVRGFLGRFWGVEIWASENRRHGELVFDPNSFLEDPPKIEWSQPNWIQPILSPPAS